MIRRLLVLSVLGAGLWGTARSQASEPTVETRHLLVSDATGKLSHDQLKDLAGQSEAVLDRVLSFWSADAQTERFGKIRVVFDAPRRDFYSCVFYWDQKGGQRTRVVQVFKGEGPPQMMAHKLTSAVFPQKDKLIRNIMGILAEQQVGNPLTFPTCGFSTDDWALALLNTGSYIPLGELGPDHESWGMRDSGGGKLSVFDKAKQQKAYAEAGSFANYLFETHGVGKIKQLQRLSQGKERPWQDAFGAGLPELEAGWLKALKAKGPAREERVKALAKLLEKDPGTACAEAQKTATAKR